MSDEEQITVGAVSAGGEGAVRLPVVELLTGRGFVTGKSGSGKSNTASVVAEKLLDGGYGLLIVDIDGEYYGLKEEYEILHVGADEECDIQVGPQHAEKIAQLALEKHVPIILDVSSFLDETKANELLTEVARHLFAKEKKLKQPFLLVVEEVHEYLPEGGGLDECGRMLIKVAKRGRKHGLGMCGISQRPADVKKDFITQCDWLVWHRLTWQNDTKVVSRILGSGYADGVEELNDGEGYLMTDWDEGVRQVQFQRKRTFDAGATPGLDDFERPELKSVSDDLVSDLERITEDQQARQSRIKELERELKDRDLRIEELESELEEARDLSDMAEQFSRAMMAHATGRPFRDDVTGYQASLDERPGASGSGGRSSAPGEDPDVPTWADVEPAGNESADGPVEEDHDGVADREDADQEEADEADETPPDEHARPRPEPDGSMTGGGGATPFEPAYEPWPDEDDLLTAAAGSGTLDGISGESNEGTAVGADADAAAGTTEADGGADILVASNDGSEEPSDGSEWDGSFDDGSAGGDILVPGEIGTGDRSEPDSRSGDGDIVESSDESDGPDTGDERATDDIIVPGEVDGDSPDEAPDHPGDTTRSEEPNDDTDGGDIIVPGEESSTDPDTETGAGEASGARTGQPDTGGRDDDSAGSPPSESPGNTEEEGHGTAGARPAGTDAGASFAEREDPAFERPVVREVRDAIESLDAVARGMLAYYRSEGPASPVDAQVAAGGDGDRTRAYGRNRQLREAGLVAHAGRGRYGYALRSRIDEAHDGRLEERALEAAVQDVEAAFLDRSDAPWPDA